ncbi:MAG TPA: Holliday junction branch migration protein RuvA [Myxococcales bacterium]|nr:Holliday junction branch migration protein RuvA [Myxococcales bacterium]HAN32354.1 Holliday junction branch migration protein RuvA [Myxococcales bacterium]
MIAWLQGEVQFIDESGLILNVAGVGYDVQVTARDAQTLQAGDLTTLWIHTVVREDALALFGFIERASRDLFRLLTSVSGVGPRGAQSLLSALSPAEIAQSIHGDQVKALTKAKGIGKRTAEMLIVKLRDRLPLDLLVEASVEPQPSTLTAEATDAISALVNLGYRPHLAKQAVETISAEQPNLNLQELITRALKALRADNAPV